jgi:hypothetical protein
VVAVPLKEPVNVVALIDDKPLIVVVVEPSVMFVEPRVNPLFTSIALVTVEDGITVVNVMPAVPSKATPVAVTLPVSAMFLGVCNAAAVDAFPLNAPVNVVALTDERPLMLVVVEPSEMLVEPRVRPLFTSIALVTVEEGIVVVSVMPAVPSKATPVAVTLPVSAMFLAVASLVEAYAVNPAADGSIHVGCAGFPRDVLDFRIYPFALGYVPEATSSPP